MKNNLSLGAQRQRLYSPLCAIILMAAIGWFTLAGCENPADNGENKNPQTEPPQSVTYVSKDSGDNLYTLEITEKLQGRPVRYAAKQGDSFKLTVELINSGTYTVALTYSGTINSAQDSGTDVVISVTVNGQPLTITISGAEMTVISGDIVNANGQKVVDTPETLTVFIDKRALETAIIAAYAAKAGVVVSANGADVLTTVYWVSQAQMTSFTTAIATAQAFYDDDEADQSMVNSAKITLTAAANVFNGQKQFGTKSGGTQDTTYDVYVAGSYSNGTQSLPCYWKNGVKTDLPLTTGEIRGWAEKIIVAGNDIYVMGNIDNGNRSIGCYWKNGTLTVMDDYATDMAISNESVFLVGSYDDIPCYWKNGMRTSLAIGNNDVGNTGSISIFDNVVYISGHLVKINPVTYDNYSTPCYWQNGVLIPLPNILGDGLFFNQVSNIFANGNGLILVGDNWYWKNNTVTTFSLDSIIRGITVNGDDIYLVGYTGDRLGFRQASYWKNGSLNILSGGSTGKDSFAYSVAIIDNDVFIAGSINVAFELVGDTMTSESTACYWKNGTIIELSSNASANSIFVAAR